LATQTHHLFFSMMHNYNAWSHWPPVHQNCIITKIDLLTYYVSFSELLNSKCIGHQHLRTWMVTCPGSLLSVPERADGPSLSLEYIYTYICKKIARRQLNSWPRKVSDLKSPGVCEIVKTADFVKIVKFYLWPTNF
jgi:hypothetical protein